MKKLAVLVCLVFLASMSMRSQVLFQDAFNYPNGLVETDGLWQVYTPAVPKHDCYVTNDLMVLNGTNSDGVEAPFTNNTGSTIVYGSFTIKVTSLPSASGGYFQVFRDGSGNTVGHVYMATKGTTIPGTYRMGVDDFVSSPTYAKYFPLDMATGITYQVVFSYDTNSDPTQVPFPNATMAVNPATIDDYAASPAYGTDTEGSAAQNSIVISQIAFSQYTGVADIGDVRVGLSFSDVMTNTPKVPVIGIQPKGQTTNLYDGSNFQLYVAASGLGQLTYQWLSNNIPLVDDGVRFIGSTSNVLTLDDLTAKLVSYKVIVANAAGSVTSSAATVIVNTNQTAPIFLAQPTSTTNYLGSDVSLSVIASGSGPINYQWYFEPTNAVSFSPIGGGNNPTLDLGGAVYSDAGTYYLSAMNSYGTTNSAIVTVVVNPPQLVSIGYLHDQMTNDVTGDYDINGATGYQVQGVVTSFSPASASTAAYGEFYIQDGTGGIYVYSGTAGTNTVPPVGALVSVTGAAQVYGGNLEIDPDVSASSNNVEIISYDNPLPPVQLLDLPEVSTNTLGTYGVDMQDSLVTLTNVYFYRDHTGDPVTNTFFINSYTTIYATEGPYSAANTNVITIFVPAYGGVATNIWGVTEPTHAYQLTGIYTYYSGPELVVTRLPDFVTTTPVPFIEGFADTNGVSTITWPAVDGSTYSVYSATNLLGPWTQAFGVSYYPPSGAYTVTNSAITQFYRVSTP